ncbi:hypothetical protein ACFPYI_04755 [Halomarina salina]|uniref:Uncharacterized protein n=1 Tax=Halomarina salina TaxID=1872699 RepID=A0ABD5RJU8_9EURY|nr:hypothetical protein [Halomarina salina]
MSRSSARRGQVEPVAALVALAVVCAALSLYAGVLGDTLAVTGGSSSDPTAESVADRARGHLTPAGVADPDRLDGVPGTAPDGYRLNATLACRDAGAGTGGEWTVGPAPPSTAERAVVPVSVRVAPGRVRPCRLAVVVWS